MTSSSKNKSKCKHRVKKINRKNKNVGLLEPKIMVPQLRVHNENQQYFNALIIGNVKIMFEEKESDRN